jgi:ribosomal protein L40E
MVPVLVCRACGALTSSARLRYSRDRLICDHCGAHNPQNCVRHVQASDIFVHFVISHACSAQGMDLDLHRTLGPRLTVSSAKTLRRLLAYLGAMPADAQ